MVLDDGTATAIGIAIGLLIISGLVALWLRSCRNHQHRASQAAAGGSNNSGQPGFRSMYIKSLIQFTNNSICNPNIIRKYFIFFALFSVQVPLRKTNINGRGAIPPVPDDQTRFTTGIGTNVNAMRSMNSYPQHPHLMTTTMTRTNGADGFTTTTKQGKNDN